MSADWRLAVDIGGTYTDVVLFDGDSGRVVVDKTLTTPADPLEGVRTGVHQLLAKAGLRPSDITRPIVPATTLIRSSSPSRRLPAIASSSCRTRYSRPSRNSGLHRRWPRVPAPCGPCR